MRKTLLVIMAAAALTAPAYAQTHTTAAPGSYAGTWGFQSEDYGNDDYGVAMSGVAVITPSRTPIVTTSACSPRK